MARLVRVNAPNPQLPAMFLGKPYRGSNYFVAWNTLTHRRFPFGDRLACRYDAAALRVPIRGAERRVYRRYNTSR